MYQELSRFYLSSLFVAALGASPASAQTAMQVNSSAPERPFAYVMNSAMRTSSGYGSGSAAVLRYAKSHPGSYVVFTDGGALHRLDAPASLSELERTLAPMRELATRQKALAAEQRPLAAQQRDLGAQQRAARDPEEMGRLGAAQAAIGQEQGDLGAVQGIIGRKQGEIGRAFHEKVRTLIGACLADGSCPQVAEASAQL